eukprot:12927891-Prorocentrum_lima.AAC.1
MRPPPPPSGFGLLPQPAQPATSGGAVPGESSAATDFSTGQEQKPSQGTGGLGPRASSYC